MSYQKLTKKRLELFVKILKTQILLFQIQEKGGLSYYDELSKLIFTKEEASLIRQFVSEEKEKLSKASEGLHLVQMNSVGESNKLVESLTTDEEKS